MKNVILLTFYVYQDSLVTVCQVPHCENLGYILWSRLGLEIGTLW